MQPKLENSGGTVPSKNAATSSSVTSSTWAHNNGLPTNILTVQTTQNSATTPSGVTYNGLALVKGIQSANQFTGFNVAIWTSVGVTLPTGSNNIVVTYAGGTTYITCTAASFYDVDNSATGATGQTGTNSTSTNPAQVTINPTLFNNSLIVGAVHYNGTPSDPNTFTPGGAGVNIGTYNAVGVNSLDCVPFYYPTGAIGSYTISESAAFVASWEIAGIELKPSAAVATPARRRQFTHH